jgi:alkanesulfonate monooxygenase SsuD/methylene tetrahydromethanopterin reductase-like flavin-dependent oxidoreductase (luciferase family)
VHETIAAVRNAGIAPNWGYLDIAMAETTPTTTIREFALHWLVEGPEYVGTPERIADMFEEQWRASGSNGGFMIAPRSGVPAGIERFVEEVVPVLQRRGLFKTEYTGRTLRENVKGR